MNRKLKFRAWDGEFMWKHSLGVAVCNDLDDTQINLKVMQFTGLHDKDGKEIYEGDIVIWPHFNDGPLPISYNSNECVFVADKLDGTPDSWLDSTCEVIGNIHENPELLND